MHSIDSTGLAALISGLKAMNEVGGSITLAALQPQANHLFKLTMFDQVFDIFDDADKAIRSFPYMSGAMTIRTEPINEDCVVVTLDGRFDASNGRVKDWGRYDEYV